MAKGEGGLSKSRTWKDTKEHLQINVKGTNKGQAYLYERQRESKVGKTLRT